MVVPAGEPFDLWRAVLRREDRVHRLRGARELAACLACHLTCREQTTERCETNCAESTPADARFPSVILRQPHKYKLHDPQSHPHQSNCIGRRGAVDTLTIATSKFRYSAPSRNKKLCSLKQLHLVIVKSPASHRRCIVDRRRSVHTRLTFNAAPTKAPTEDAPNR